MFGSALLRHEEEERSKERWVGNAVTRCKGVGMFRSALLRRVGVRGFGFGIGCSGVIQMTRDGHTVSDAQNRQLSYRQKQNCIYNFNTAQDVMLTRDM